MTKVGTKSKKLMSHIISCMCINYRFTIPSHFANWRRFTDYKVCVQVAVQYA